MRVVLVDNGSLEPAAVLNLRAVAAALSARCGVEVHAASWKHSDGIPASALGGEKAWCLAPWVRDAVARGERRLLLVPFFISAQGAIGSALRHDLENLQRELPRFDFAILPGLAALHAIPRIVADRVQTTLAATGLRSPAVVVVDHGGPSRASAELRDRVTAEVRTLLGGEPGLLAAASMEGAFPPLLADLLHEPRFAGRDTIVAPLFLSPGRHAGADGDIARLCRSSPARCHLTELVGTHPLVADTLAPALRAALSSLHSPSFA